LHPFRKNIRKFKLNRFEYDNIGCGNGKLDERVLIAPVEATRESRLRHLQPKRQPGTVCAYDMQCMSGRCDDHAGVCAGYDGVIMTSSSESPSATAARVPLFHFS
jgi:hypothetical protein